MNAGPSPVALRYKRQVGIRFRKVPAQRCRRRHRIFISLLGNRSRAGIVKNQAQLAFVLRG